MKLKRILLASLMIVFLAVIASFIRFPKAVEAEGIKPFTITGKLNSSGYATPRNDGKIELTIETKYQISGSATISYKTFDKTAVAKAGDYTPVEGTCVITGSGKQYIYISVKTVDYIANVDGSSVYFANYFSFEITNVEGDYTIDDFDRTSIDCEVSYRNKLPIESTSIGYTFSMYKEVISGEFTHASTDLFHQITEDYSENLKIDNSKFRIYKKLGFADEYFGSRLLSFKETSSSSAKIQLQCWYYADNDWQLLQYLDLKAGSNGDETSWSDVNNNGGLVKEFVSNTTTQVVNGMKLSKLPSGAHETARTLGLINKWAFSADRPCKVGWYDAIYDSKAPTVKGVYGTTFYAYENGKKVEKLRVSVRFTEPVSLTNTNVKIKCSLGNAGTELFTMNYAGGSLTNTLFFETSLTSISQAVTSNKYYDTICLKEIVNGSNIIDFSLDNNPLTETKKAVYGQGVSIDLRTPSVSATPDKTISASKIVNLSVDLCKSGTIYYKWVKKGEHLTNPTNESAYPNKVNFTSNGSTVIQTQRFEADGEYFLYVYCVSTNGRTDRRIFGRDGQTTDSEQKNGFLFDNVPPEISSSLKRKHTGLNASNEKIEVEFLNDEDVKVLISDASNNQVLNASYKYTLAQDGTINLSSKVGTGSYTFNLKYLNNRVSFITSSDTVDLVRNDFEVDGLKEKVLSFNIFDKTENNVASGLYKIELDFYNRRTGEFGFITLWDGSNLSSGNTYQNSALGIQTKNVEGGLFCDANVTAKIQSKAFGVGDNEYGDFICNAHISDAAGNIIIVPVNDGNYVRFDTRIRLDTFTESASKANAGFNINEKAYDITGGLKVTFDSGVSTNPSVNGLHFDWLTVDNVKYNFLDEHGAYSTELESSAILSLKDYFDISFISNGGTQPTKIEMDVKKACYVSVGFVYDKEQKTDIYDYYFTFGFNDETPNYVTFENSNLLNNKVYFLNSENPFYYLDNQSYSIKKLKYNDTSFNIAFSTKATAFNYLRYYELQDLSILYIADDDLANKLNFSSDNRYLKDDSCKGKTAKRGEYWIKYKSSTWNLNQAGNPSYWRYYYYGNDNLHSELSELLIEECTALNDAINYVCTLLADTGFENTYLVGDDYTVNGIPYLDKAQIISKDLATNVTMNGDKYKNQITFGQDTAIYSSYVTKEVKGENVSIKLVPSWIIDQGNHTKILYHPYDGITEPNLNEFFEYKETGKAFQKALPVDTGSSIYIIYEFNDFGAHKYMVFIDNDTPSLKVSALIDGNDVIDVYDSSSTGTTIGAKGFGFDRLIDNADEYSYVALYRKTVLGRSYIATYRMKDILDGRISLENNNYIIVVGDRSGNIFEMSLYINAEDLKVEGLTEKEVKENIDYLQIKCNRTFDQIKRYEVYLGNRLLTNEYKQVNRFNETGYYTVIIEDIYNNTVRYDNVYFERVLPLVNIKYMVDGNFVFYDENNIDDDAPLQVVSIGNGTYSIKTSTRIQFTFEQRLDFEVISGTFNGRMTQALGAYYITVDELAEWTIRIFYSDYPDVGITYMCLVDEVAPTIDVSYENQSYVGVFFNELNDKAIALKENGIELIPSSILYKENTDEHGNKITNVIYVYDNGVIGCEKFKFSVKDYNGVRKVEFQKLNEKGEFVSLEGYSYENVDSDPTFNLNEIEVSEYGTFRIVATDLFGNKSSFQFTNEDVSYYSRTVDDLKNETSSVVYGNSSDILKISSKGIIQYFITKNGVKHFYMFYASYEGIAKAHYVTHFELDEGGNPIINEKINYELSVDELVFDPEKPYKLNEWYSIPGLEVSLEYMTDGKSYFFRVLSDETLTRTEASIILFDNTVYHSFISELSKEVTDIDLIDYATGSKIETNHDGEMILTHKEFSVFFDNLSDAVERIRIAYSKSLSFTAYSTIYKKGSEPIDFSTARDGFYSIRILNVYGNTLEYTISKQNSLSVTAQVTYKDGSMNGYSNEYNQTIYSNDLIKFIVISESCTIVITKDGNEYMTVEPSIEEVKQVVLSLPGKYELVISDAYGNTVYRSCEIKEETLTFNEDLIYGYNERALGKKDGYTNKKLTIDYLEMIESGIAYLAVRYQDELYILHDLVSENRINGQGNQMIGILGSFGNGDYKVITRDKFGNYASKDIHYSDTPTLIVEKNSRSNINFIEVYSDEYVNDGVWSNNAISIDSTSNNRIIKLDGSDAECPIKFNFSSDIGYGSFIYDIYYLDEYGFEYEFKCYLLRETIEIEIPSSISTETIGGVITTKDDISITFLDSLNCKYVIDGGSTEYDYVSGSTLYKDGTYRFTVFDKAGNTQTLTMCKDSGCYFSFVEQKTGANLISGQVVNSNRVVFTSPTDSARLTKVYRNGVLVKEDLNGVFIEDGRYDCIIEDEIGNFAFFIFYIINKGLSKFDYSVPYDYIITSMWLKKTTGERYSVMDLIDVKEGFAVSPQSVMSDDGVYEVEMKSTITSKTITFKFTIDNTPPNIVLEGCNEGETTLNTVTLKNYNVGDKIEIYRNGKLTKTVNITSSSDAPTFTDGGNYKIVITNQAGVTQTLEFTKTRVANLAGSILIIIIIMIFIVALFVGLLLRNRSRVDK